MMNNDEKMMEEYNLKKEKLSPIIQKDEQLFPLSNTKHKINEYIEKNGFDKQVQDVEDFVMEYGDIDDIWNWFLYVKGAHVEKVEDAIINYTKKVKNSWAIGFFARDAKDANIEKLTRAALKYGQAPGMYGFDWFVFMVNKRDDYSKALEIVERVVRREGAKKDLKCFETYMGIDKDEIELMTLKFLTDVAKGKYSNDNENE